MTVVNPKSISGINSITMASGSDNLLTIHTTNTTERVRVNSDGDVIVGSGITVSPDGDIFTTGVTTATTFVGALTGNVTGNISGGTVAGSTGTFSGDVTANGGDMTISGSSAILHLVDTNDNPNYRVQNIGGTFQIYDATTDTARLSIASGGAATFSGNVSGATGTFTNGILLNDNISHIDNTNTKIRFPSNNNFSVEVNGSEGFRVSPSGTTVTTTTDASFFVNTTNSSGSHIRLQTSGTTKTYLGQAQGISGTLGGADDLGVMSAGKINFGTNGSATKRLEVETGGDVKVSTGNLVIGTAGKGIDFSATGDASGATSELFNDYEEGDWTPSLSMGSPTYVTQVGKYTKIGELVLCSFYLDYSNGSNSSQRNNAMLFFAHSSSIIALHQYSTTNPIYQTGWGSSQVANGDRFKWAWTAQYRTDS